MAIAVCVYHGIKKVHVHTVEWRSPLPNLTKIIQLADIQAYKILDTEHNNFSV
jgi:hypothetical protein